MTVGIEMVSSSYVNRDLFSERFLRDLLPARPEWSRFEGEAREAMEALRALFETVGASLPSLNEAQLEERWIRRVLEILGHTFEVQFRIPTDTPGNDLVPDYALFASPEERDLARDCIASGRPRDAARHIRMLADAKKWGRDFGFASRGQRSPKQQMADYLLRSGVDWGFLTDGRHFRLVHRSVAGRLDHFYLVDLPAALQARDLDAFRYFYLFFGGPAIRADPRTGRTFLDEARDESLTYAAGVGEGLKDSVYEALSRLAQGIVTRRAADPPVEDAIGRECLVLLYRLLFLFYAEHRRLLPLDDPRYAEVSLTRLSHEVADGLDRGAMFLLRGVSLWGRLRTLFDLVDRGDEELRVPAYNGGLFHPDFYPFVASSAPGDRDFAHALDLLARTRPGRDGTRHFLDYRDLDIRHLGTIYEGLLEYRVRIATADLAVVRDAKGKTERYEPHDASRHPGVAVPKGRAYLVTDRGERKASGSFYTPDFVVEHIVAETLQPLVEGKTPEEILALRVVDPAMGSGHFLIAAADFLARAYGQALLDAGRDEDGALSDADLASHRRLIAERCLYGVDLNPMAVELAKVALWLKTMAAQRALTFLDHHLKCGNSLLGARVERIGHPLEPPRGVRERDDAPRQIEMFQSYFEAMVPMMVGELFRILGRETLTREDVTLKEVCDRQVEEIRRPFATVADAYLAQAFGSPAHRFYDALALLHDRHRLAGSDAAREVAPLAASKGFFHWELMFPEVFYDANGHRRADAGFDAVIGNPPWVRQETIKEDKEALHALYPEVFHPAADIYAYFVALGLSLLAPGGRLGMVLPNKWLRAEYGRPLREALLRGARPVGLVDFGHAPIFPDADTFPCILIAKKGREQEPAPPLRVCPVPREALGATSLTVFVREHQYEVPADRLRPEGWVTPTPEVARLLDKVRTAGRPLKEVIGTSPIRGVLTGFNEAFLIDQATRDRLVAEDPGCAPVIRKFLRGRDIERWHPRWGGEWMIALKSSENHAWPWADAGDRAEEVFRRTFPSIHHHMKAQETSLKKREDRGRFWWELRSCDYYDLLDKTKIVYQEIHFHNWFAIDLNGYHLNNLVHLLPLAEYGLLSALNSSLLHWYMWYTAPHKKDEALALHSFYMENLPIVPGPPEPAQRLVQLTAERQAAEEELLAWLRDVHGLERVSKKLAIFWSLDWPAFAAELKKARVRASPAALSEVRTHFEDYRARIQALLAQSRTLEREVHETVFRLYGLTDEEVALVRRTAPPRDPYDLHATIQGGRTANEAVTNPDPSEEETRG